MRSANINNEFADITLTDAVAQVRKGAPECLTRIMQAHNQRLFRIARSILRDSHEAEDIVQDTFIKAFTNAADLRDVDKIAPWLASITVNLAKDRLRQISRRRQLFETPENPDVIPINRAFQQEMDAQTSPEKQAAMSDVRYMIEAEIDRLPDGFREVFVLRVIEQMSIAETSTLLGIQPATVKTRLHRAKSLIRKGLEGRLDAESLNAFPFGGVHCARTTKAVIAYLQKGPTT